MSASAEYVWEQLDMFPPTPERTTSAKIVQLRPTPADILNPGFDLTLRPMRYPQFYDMYVDAIRNTWTVEEVNLGADVSDLAKMSEAERHMIRRLVAFFATGDSIVANNLVLNLYKHINTPEARMYLSRQLYEEALHIQFYLTLLDTYIPDHGERNEAFAAIENIPSIRQKAEFCMRWIGSINDLDELTTREDRKKFLLNLICFAACIEGMFFFAAFAYVYFLRSKGLLNGLATGTDWVFRDESGHMNFAFAVIEEARQQEPELFDDDMARRVTEMVTEAVEVEMAFAQDVLSIGVAGMSIGDMRQYLEAVADLRLTSLGIDAVFGSTNPFGFLEIQNVQGLTNFFERQATSYQVAVGGEVSFDDVF